MSCVTGKWLRDAALVPSQTSSRRRCCCARAQSVTFESDFRFEIVDWVVLYNRHADFERKGDVIGQVTPNSRIERKEQTPGLAGQRIAKVHADIGAGISETNHFSGRAMFK